MTLATIVSAEDLFEQLEEEPERETNREIALEANERVLNLLDLWANNKIPIYGMFNAKDVEEFSKLLPAYVVQARVDDRKTSHIGDTLTTLIDHCLDHCVKIHTVNFPSRIDRFSFRSARTIEVLGNLGNFAGSNLLGRMTISGNVRDFAGHHLDGGELTINGYAGEFLGLGMNKGKIIAKFNAGRCAGLDMNGGEIHIYGYASEGIGKGMKGGAIYLYDNFQDIGRNISLNDMEEGRIYYKNKLVAKDGRLIR